MTEIFKLSEVSIGEGTQNIYGSTESWHVVVILIYISISTLFLGRLSLGLIRISSLRRRGILECKSGHELVWTKEEFSPFSFFNTIFISESHAEKYTLDHVIQHELSHIKQHHTLDNLLVEILLSLFWFNPFLWGLRRSLKETHEYLADAGVQGSIKNIEEYQSLLLMQIGTLSRINLTCNFNSTIKNRIKMMYKRRSGHLAQLKPLLTIPVILSLTLIISCSASRKQSGNPAPPDISASEIAKENPAEEVYYIVEEMPEFNDGDPAIEFRKYIAQNLRYPKIAAENGIQGRTIVQFTVNCEGKVVDATIVRSVDPALDKESIRVAMASPDWTPGKQKGENVSVMYTFPINFVLQTKQKEDK
ncbi:MAG: M56 family metallopeptidase [Bacteroidales bacterium]|nr:M56 family metallopeptidase [Bacteroidales bacterium]